MNFLDEIYMTYRATAECIEHGGVDPGAALGLSRDRMAELSEYAFFVLLFGQLEDYVNCAYQDFFGMPWKSAAFEHRVNLIFREREADDATAELVLDYYDLRCELAHGHAEGGIMGDRIHIAGVYESIRAIMGDA